MSAEPSIQGRVEAVWRLESARIVAGLVRMVHDVGRAEELAQGRDQRVLEQWPAGGVPDNPGAWLMRWPSAGPSTTCAASSASATARSSSPPT